MNAFPIQDATCLVKLILNDDQELCRDSLFLVSTFQGMRIDLKKFSGGIWRLEDGGCWSYLKTTETYMANGRLFTFRVG